MGKNPPRNSIEAYMRNLVIYSHLSTCGSGVLIHAFSPTEHIVVSVEHEGSNLVKSIAFIDRLMYNKSLDRIKNISI